MKDVLVYGQGKSWLHLRMLIEGKIKPPKFIIDIEHGESLTKHIPLVTINSYNELIKTVEKIKKE
jgi:hypothetical protein